VNQILREVSSLPAEIDYRAFYEGARARIAHARAKLGPLTLANKILAAHCTDFDGQTWEPGKATLRLNVDRVALQDATAQMALLQFIQARRPKVAVPTSVHCDHLIQAHVGAKLDLEKALGVNQEVYDFLSSASSKYGNGFWQPGSGIIHQVVLENYAFPGGLMIGTDSHTPNAGGLGMISIGVGGADAAEVMAGLPYEVKQPRVIGVHLTGALSGWAAPKDVITTLCTMLTVKGGTDCVVEYFGPGAKMISPTGRATICNMGAELGATGSVFPMDENAAAYLGATGRGDLADLALEFMLDLRADEEVLLKPENYYDRIVEINLDTIRPYIVGPHSPDKGRPVYELGEEARANGWPLQISACLIGSCTNSSVGDMTRAAEIAQQALDAGLTLKVPLFITPGSERVLRTLERDGILAVFEKIGATVLTNACGPCIGQWHRDGIKKGDRNVIVSSYNRNFPARNDENPETLSFLTSPEVVMALAFGGTLDFDPVAGKIQEPDDSDVYFSFDEPNPESFPVEGLVDTFRGYVPPSETPEAVEVIIAPDSHRLQLLEPFAPWDGKDFIKLPILLKAKGKTTTDSISPAGKWLTFRGHLDRISDNMFLGAVNAYTDEIGIGFNPITGSRGDTFTSIARMLKKTGHRWVVIGGENYGEGSSREHAAMSPRFLGCAAVIVKSFARIHEANLKKQGILPLTLVDPNSYDLFGEHDSVTVSNLAGLAPNTMVTVTITPPDGPPVEVLAKHTMNAEQITWFKAGSALNTRST